MNALVLGGGANDKLAAESRLLTKGLIYIAGRPMAHWVMEAIRGAGFDRVAFVGPRFRLEPEPDFWVPDTGDLIQNVEAGLEVLGSEDRVLISTIDIPLVTPEIVRGFLKLDPGADLVYPIIPREEVEAKYPGARRTYVRLREGVYTGGNMVILDPAKAERMLRAARRVVAFRKNPLALAMLFGPGVLLKLLLGRLSVAELEARVSRILEVSARAVVVPYPEIGMDVDKPEDVELVAQILFRRSEGA